MASAKQKAIDELPELLVSDSSGMGAFEQ